VKVQILDTFNNLTSSTASVSVAANGPGGFSGGSTTSVAAVNGVATFSNLVLNKASTGYTISISSTGLTGVTSSSFNVTAAAATHFLVSAPAGILAGSAFNFIITAQDQFNNTAIYSGTMHFTSSDGNATLPADSTLMAGTSSLSATLRKAGNRTITATDTVNSSITGTSNTI